MDCVRKVLFGDLNGIFVYLGSIIVIIDVTGKRYVAAHWDTKKNISEARAASEEEVAWQQLSGSPVWPGGKPD